MGDGDGHGAIIAHINTEPAGVNEYPIKNDRARIVPVTSDSSENLSNHDTGFDTIPVNGIFVRGNRIPDGDSSNSIHGIPTNPDRLIRGQRRIRSRGKIKIIRKPVDHDITADGVFPITGDRKVFTPGFPITSGDIPYPFALGVCRPDPTIQARD